MKINIKKTVVLEDYERNTLLQTIHILEGLSDEGVEEEWMNSLVSDLEGIVYRDGWEVEQYD